MLVPIQKIRTCLFGDLWPTAGFVIIFLRTSQSGRREENSNLKPKIASALSASGFRTSWFHLGVIKRRLAKADLLRQGQAHISVLMLVMMVYSDLPQTLH